MLLFGAALRHGAFQGPRLTAGLPCEEAGTEGAFGAEEKVLFDSFLNIFHTILQLEPYIVTVRGM